MANTLTRAETRVLDHALLALIAGFDAADRSLDAKKRFRAYGDWGCKAPHLVASLRVLERLDEKTARAQVSRALQRLHRARQIERPVGNDWRFIEPPPMTEEL